MKEKEDMHIEIKGKIPHVQIANSTIRDKSMSGLEKAILALILSHDQEKFVISRGTIFKSFTDSKYMITKSILGLKNKNYLKIVRHRDKTKFGRWVYEVMDKGLPFPSNKDNDSSDSKNTTTVEPNNKGDTVNAWKEAYKKTNHKKTNDSLNKDLSEVCEEKKGLIVNNNEEPQKATISEALQQAHTQEVKPEFGKTEHPLTHPTKSLEQIKNDDYLRSLAITMGVNIDAITEEEYTKPTTEIALPKRTEKEINLHYSQEIAKVEQELVAQRDINLPKLTTESLLGASEDFLRRVGIGFDHSPRRILNLIYKNLPSDYVIKEDGKDVEILGDMIKKYMASRQDERESIAKRIYQAVEAMLKIYVIKKYGQPYREVLYPEILRANLTLYINCNPTFKYCLGGFSNDIDGVYLEVCRLVEKDNKKKISLLKLENEKKIRQLEANKRAELQSIFSEKELADFERRKSNIMDRSNFRGFDGPELDKPIKVNLTESEKHEMRELFAKSDQTPEEKARLNFLIVKSRKMI